jgi:hypothetical protein
MVDINIRGCSRIARRTRPTVGACHTNKLYLFASGSNIIANRPTHETELQAEVTNFAIDGYDTTTQAQAIGPSSQTKIFNFFKAKKTPSQQYVNTVGLGAGQGGTLQANSASSTLVRNNNTSLPQAAQASNNPYGGGPTTNGRYLPHDGHGRTGLGPDPRNMATVGGGVEVFETSQQAIYQQPAYASATTPSTRGFYTGSESPVVGSSSLQGQGAFGNKLLGQGQVPGPTDPFGFQLQQQKPNVTGYADASLRTGGLVGGGVTGAWASTPAANGAIIPSTTYAHGNGTYQDPRSTMSLESRRAAMMQRTGQSSFDDRLPALSERRNSLPSIVKTRADVAPSTSVGHGAQFRGTAAATNAATAAGGRVDPKNVAGRRPQVDTFVIENGVRKRVRYELRIARMYDKLKFNAGSRQLPHQQCPGCG